MKESAILDLYEVYREQTIELIDPITEDEADVIPNGFSNSLRWNFGHILVAQEQSMFNLGLGRDSEIPFNIIEAFRRGTNPSDWAFPPLSLNEIKSQLNDQKKTS